MIGVNGRLQTRSYERQDGTKAYVTEVIANTVEYLSSKSDNSAKTQQNEVVEVAEVPVSVSDDDLPF